MNNEPHALTEQSSDVPVVILCGGLGTRAYPATAEMPKPMMPIAGRPILEHVMLIFAEQGFSRFILSVGYLGEVVRAWATVTERVRPWTIDVIDTGEDAGTGARVLRVADVLKGRRFLVTYGDGLGDVRIAQLLSSHLGAVSEGAVATVTTVPLRSQFGTVTIDDHRMVTGFQEKPVLRQFNINAGFMVFENSVLDSWPGDDLERDVLPALSDRRTLHAYQHNGFWKSMDTQKDQSELQRLAIEGGAPWLSFPDNRYSLPAQGDSLGVI